MLKTAVWLSNKHTLYCVFCLDNGGPVTGEFALRIGVDFRFNTEKEEVFQPQQQDLTDIICTGCGGVVRQEDWALFTENPTFQKMLALNGYQGGTDPNHHWTSQPPKLKE